MEVPEGIMVGRTTLTLAKSSCAVQTIDGTGQHFDAFCFVGEGWSNSSIKWFLSSLEDYEKKKVRVEESVVEKCIHECCVFLRIGEFTFRQYEVKNGHSGHVSANISSKAIDEDTYDVSLCNSPRSLYYLSRSRAQVKGDTPSGTRKRCIAMENTDSCEEGNISHYLSLSLSSKDIRNAHGSGIIQEEEEDEKEIIYNRKDSTFSEVPILPPLLPPTKPPMELEPDMRSPVSFRSRRFHSPQLNEK
ncbi:uncharacterized protein TM35_000016630 [Trypanosoma theileri]|uniref:Uncharacterized protein n=1 Tax=Trypanosoma theileri TaxID=67003 RepID=A0A1X0PA35_9TRYP|nr:uncharacterized protein TM35_000016630 [Trypanosoma theileri]ORC93786.1 hypothetical protein TM35_000016630 [Trypanosoma theileri]